MLTWFRSWRLRGRLVLLHIEGSNPSLQGIYKGARGRGSARLHFLDVPHFVTSEANPAPVEGWAAVPGNRVIWVQVLS